MANFLTNLFSRKPKSVREPHFAGHLYPDEEAALGRALADLVDASSSPDDDAPSGTLRALVLPFGELAMIAHVARPAIELLARHAHAIERVVVISSAQRIPFQGLALSAVEAWRTPLANCWLDEELASALAGRFPERARFIDDAHAVEPGIESVLPMLQAAFARKKKQPRYTPILAGDGALDLLEGALDAIWGGDGVLVVISTELAVGVDAARAKSLAEELARALEGKDASLIGRAHASARLPLKALAKRLAREPDARARALSISHSMHEQVSHLRAVSERTEALCTGYGAFAIETS